MKASTLLLFALLPAVLTMPHSPLSRSNRTTASCSGKKTFRIGVLLPSIAAAEGKLNQPVKAIEMATEEINRDSSLLSNACIEVVQNDTTYGRWESMEAALWQVNIAHVDAIIGPTDGSTTQVVSPIVETAAVPILTPSAVSLDATSSFLLFPTLFRLSPRDSFLPVAVNDVLSHFSWKKVAIIATSDYSGQAILQYLENERYKGLQIVATVLLNEPHNELDEVEVKAIQNLKTTGATIFVVAVTGSELGPVLEVALDSGLINESYAWILAWCNYGIDVFHPETMDGLLCIRQYADEKAAQNLWNKLESTQTTGIGTTTWLDSLYTYDATMAIAQALDRITVNTSTPTYDDDGHFRPHPSSYSEQLLKNLQTGVFHGLSGPFNLSSPKDPLRYEILNYHDNKLVEIGAWTSESKFIFLKESDIYWPGNSSTTPTGTLRGQNVVNVLVPISWPFSGLTCEGWPKENECFDGVAIRLMNNISETLGLTIKYELWRNGSWTDMVKFIGSKDNPYDMAVGSVTVTKERSSYATFSRSIYTSGIRILTRPSQKIEPGLFEFFKPFQFSVWLLIAVCFILGAFVIWYLDEEAVASETPKVYKKMNWAKRAFHHWVDSTYFSFSIFFFVQHQDAVNNTWARVFLIVACFFVLTMVGAYTANMAAFLTHRPHVTDTITDYKDLNGRTVIARNGTASVSYIKEDLNLQKNLIIANTGDEAVQLLLDRKGDAYISDTPHVLGLEAKDCRVVVVGMQEQLQYYAFPTKEGFAYLDQLNKEIAVLVQAQFVINTLTEVLNKTCPPMETESDAPEPIGIRDVKGLLILSAGIASFFVIMKAIYHVGVRARKQAKTFNIYVADPEETDKTTKVDGGIVGPGTYNAFQAPF